MLFFLLAWGLSFQTICWRH